MARGHRAFMSFGVARSLAFLDTRQVNAKENETGAENAPPRAARRPWISPVLEPLEVGAHTKGGGDTDIIENGFYHT